MAKTEKHQSPPGTDKGTGGRRWDGKLKEEINLSIPQLAADLEMNIMLNKYWREIHGNT